MSRALASGGTGAVPETLATDLADRNHQRGALKLLARSIDNGWIEPWQVSGEAYKDMPGLVESILRDSVADGDRRSANNAAKVLAALSAHNLRLLEVTDKMARLDAGLATENVQQTHTVSFDSQG